MEGRWKAVEGRWQAKEGRWEAVECQPKAVEGQRKAVEGQRKAMEGQRKAKEGSKLLLEHGEAPSVRERRGDVERVGAAGAVRAAREEPYGPDQVDEAEGGGGVDGDA